MPMSWLVTMLMSSLLTMLMFSLLTMQMSWLQTQQMSWLQTSMWLPNKSASGGFFPAKMATPYETCVVCTAFYTFRLSLIQKPSNIGATCYDIWKPANIGAYFHNI